MKKHQTIFEVVKRFNTEARCVSHLERIRWPHGLECLHCKGKRVMKFHAKGKTGKKRS
ncbi:MAG: transposase [Nitrospiraceae bacterium]|jgi:DNA-directed RNA polymerase subunit RPC12/RpoP